MNEKDFEEWRIKHHEASLALENREERLHDIYEEVEMNMTLIGRNTSKEGGYFKGGRTQVLNTRTPVRKVKIPKKAIQLYL